MSYFTQEYISFMQGLSVNNNKDWFNENKSRYEQFVKLPFKTFVSALVEKLNNEGFHYSSDPNRFIFRIYRDVRFSEDKVPYKTHVSALINANGKKDKTDPGLYIQFSAKDVRLYSGCHVLDAQQLNHIRTKILKEPDRFRALTEDKNFVGTFSKIRGDKNKRIPAQYEESAKTQSLLYNKAFYYFIKYSPNLVLEPNIVEILINHYKNCIDMNTFFQEALNERR